MRFNDSMLLISMGTQNESLPGFNGADEQFQRVGPGMTVQSLAIKRESAPAHSFEKSTEPSSRNDSPPRRLLMMVRLRTVPVIMFSLPPPSVFTVLLTMTRFLLSPLPPALTPMSPLLMPALAISPLVRTLLLTEMTRLASPFNWPVPMPAEARSPSVITEPLTDNRPSIRP